MNRSYFGLSRGSAVSGAGWYSHKAPRISCGIEPLAAGGRAIALGVVISVALGGFCEVVRRLVRAGLFLFDLPQQVVEQRAGAEPIARRVEPGVAEGFLDGHEIVESLLRRADSSRRFHPDRDPRRQIEIANGFDHHLGVGERGTARRLAGAGLDEITSANRLHREE